MELYQLKTFVAVAEEGHLTRAAERLHLSQPAVSLHVKSLEEELGVALFSRTPKGMVLTGEGALLKGQAEKILAQAGDFLHQARGLREELVGILRLGLNYGPEELHVPDILARLRARHPRLELQLISSMSGYIIEDLRHGRLDAGFFYGDPPADLNAVAIRTDRLAIIGPTAWNDRLAGASWADLAAMPWVWVPPSCPMHQTLEDALARRGLGRPTKAAVADNEVILTALVAAGHGLSILVATDAQRAEAEGRVCIWPGAPLSITLHFAARRDSGADPLARALTDAVAEVWAEAEATPAPGLCAL